MNYTPRNAFEAFLIEQLQIMSGICDSWAAVCKMKQERLDALAAENASLRAILYAKNSTTTKA